jgi:hypothetical protein
VPSWERTRSPETAARVATTSLDIAPRLLGGLHRMGESLRSILSTQKNEWVEDWVATTSASLRHHLSIHLLHASLAESFKVNPYLCIRFKVIHSLAEQEACRCNPPSRVPERGWVGGLHACSSGDQTRWLAIGTKSKTK